ncbi:hypothetical protein BDP81DRAFT_450594 [Colletotrichum phormii]|uniref:Vegetative incompatibility protein HET-E-1 n=1 Tax=Colletotrichum phormii TaxID=359342 RepID=A0AAI9ZPE5_9PEZI|nr:uncharacterized protein BDP81DRAFT_450594 [Colletotrichum phormii]KAK1635742.1 hypothetical protein BDP81DRAFT_450594 [Colletotrichum phormii]
MPHDTVMTRREDSLDEPIYAQYRFSQTVPSGQGIGPHIRLLSVSEDILATVHGDRDVLIWNVKRNLPPQRIEIEIVLDFITGIAISPASSNIVALSFRLGPKCEVWTFNWADQVAEAMFTTGLDLHSPQFSPDGRLLAWISAGSVDVWETIINTHVQTVSENQSGRLVSWDVVTWSYIGESKVQPAMDDDGREPVQLVTDNRRVMMVSREVGEVAQRWRLTTWWPSSDNRSELEMDGCVYGCVPGNCAFVATVQSDGGKLRIRDTNKGMCFDQSTQGIAKRGKTPSVVMGGMVISGKIMVTQLANGRTTIWQLVATE